MSKECDYCSKAARFAVLIASLSDPNDPCESVCGEHLTMGVDEVIFKTGSSMVNVIDLEQT